MFVFRMDLNLQDLRRSSKFRFMLMILEYAEYLESTKSRVIEKSGVNEESQAKRRSMLPKAEREHPKPLTSLTGPTTCTGFSIAALWVNVENMFLDPINRIVLRLSGLCLLALALATSNGSRAQHLRCRSRQGFQFKGS